MAVPPGNPDEPLQELKHDAVPGFPKAFVIAFVAMALYFLLILVTSPGKVEKHHGDDAHGHAHGDKPSATSAHEDKPAH